MKNFKKINLILTSFSSRAAAECFSKLENINIYSFDYFGDLDLKETADYSFSLKEKNKDFKTEELFKALKKFLIKNKNEDYYLIYGSNWDNQPEFLYKLEEFENLKLRGNSAAVISALNKKKSLKDLFKTAKKAGFKTPDLFSNQNKMIEFLSRENKELIIKPYNSGGGLGTEIIKNQKKFKEVFAEKKGDFYLEEFIDGENRSCQFAADGKSAEILAFTKELKAAQVNSKMKNSFKYAGNILIKEDAKEIKIIKRFIQNITNKYSLQGINGIDYIKNEQGIFFIELNPRFTAAVELLIPFYQKEFINIYFKKEFADDYLTKYLEKDFAFSAKVIYYADQHFKVKKDLREILKKIKTKTIIKNFNDSQIEIKDLPKKGEKFSKDEPVFTLIIKTESKNLYLKIKNLLFSEFKKYFKEEN